ncbi:MULTISPECIES: LPS O-antigen chain length determinant protein WzzB [unclassified Serratia (in: enterobacteria)]|uniref:LPS O-antigen chain length determinant protein WzzB n=1 Tax=unclassified Serratia (in: enterobacteria) TaxID=2647522 RepID=UPI003076064E
MSERLPSPPSPVHSTNTKTDGFSPYLPFNNNNETSFFTLLSLLWCKRWLIIAIIVSFISIAAIYTFIAKEKWTATAVLLPPRVAQLGNYLELRRDYGLIIDQVVEPKSLSVQLFNEFIEFASMTDEKMAFLQKSDYYQRSIKKLNSAEEKQSWLLKAAEKQLNVKESKNIKDESSLIISIQADDASTAKNLLENYIKITNEKTFNVVNSELLNNINARVNKLQKERQDIIFDAKAKRKSEIKLLQNALAIARKGGINSSLYSSFSDKEGNVDSTNKYHFMIGEKIIAAELEQLQQSEPLYSVRYYQIENELKQLAVLKQKKAEAQSYSYELSPLLPTQRDAPKTILILILGAFAGLICGIAVVLVQHTINMAHKK